MRDPGLSEAIQAVGGVSELARRIGISQPSVSNWDKVPAERVLAVEAATGIARVRLRPDLYREQSRRASTRSISRARRNTRCSPRCWRARPTPRCSQRLARLGGDASPLGRRACGARRGRGARRRRPGRARILRSVHRARARRAAALRLLLSHRLPARAAAGAAARGSRALGIERVEGNTSRRITPRSCARSWRRSPAGASRRAEGADRDAVREAPGAVDRALLRRSRTRRRPATSTPRRHARPRVHGNRKEAFALPA